MSQQGEHLCIESASREVSSISLDTTACPSMRNQFAKGVADVDGYYRMETVSTRECDSYLSQSDCRRRLSNSGSSPAANVRSTPLECVQFPSDNLEDGPQTILGAGGFRLRACSTPIIRSVVNSRATMSPNPLSSEVIPHSSDQRRLSRYDNNCASGKSAFSTTTHLCSTSIEAHPAESVAALHAPGTHVFSMENYGRQQLSASLRPLESCASRQSRRFGMPADTMACDKGMAEVHTPCSPLIGDSAAFTHAVLHKCKSDGKAGVSLTGSGCVPMSATSMQNFVLSSQFLPEGGDHIIKEESHKDRATNLLVPYTVTVTGPQADPPTMSFSAVAEGIVPNAPSSDVAVNNSIPPNETNEGVQLSSNVLQPVAPRTGVSQTYLRQHGFVGKAPSTVRPCADDGNAQMDKPGVKSSVCQQMKSPPAVADPLREGSVLVLMPVRDGLVVKSSSYTSSCPFGQYTEQRQAQTTNHPPGNISYTDEWRSVTLEDARCTQSNISPLSSQTTSQCTDAGESYLTPFSSVGLHPLLWFKPSIGNVSPDDADQLETHSSYLTVSRRRRFLSMGDGEHSRLCSAKHTPPQGVFVGMAHSAGTDARPSADKSVASTLSNLTAHSNYSPYCDSELHHMPSHQRFPSFVMWPFVSLTSFSRGTICDESSLTTSCNFLALAQIPHQMATFNPRQNSDGDSSATCNWGERRRYNEGFPVAGSIHNTRRLTGDRSLRQASRCIHQQTDEPTPSDFQSGCDNGCKSPSMINNCLEPYRADADAPLAVLLRSKGSFMQSPHGYNVDSKWYGGGYDKDPTRCWSKKSMNGTCTRDRLSDMRSTEIPNIDTIPYIPRKASLSCSMPHNLCSAVVSDGVRWSDTQVYHNGAAAMRPKNGEPGHSFSLYSHAASYCDCANGTEGISGAM